MVKKKGRASGPVVSLFAFQDIITATTGIIILFILALALLVAEQAPPDVAELTDTTTDVLNDQLNKVQQQLSVLKSELERAESFSRESAMTEEEFKARLKFVSNSKELIESEQTKIDAQVEKLNTAKDKLLKHDSEYKRSLEEIEQAVEKLVERENLLGNNDYTSDLKTELSKLEREIDDLKSKLAKHDESSVKIVEYEFTQFERKDVWIVHIRKGWCRLIHYGSEKSATTYDGSVNPLDNDDEAVAKWIADKIIEKNTAIDDFYIYLAIAPSGVSIFHDVLLKLESHDDLAYGFDLLPNNRVELE